MTAFLKSMLPKDGKFTWPFSAIARGVAAESANSCRDPHVKDG